MHPAICPAIQTRHRLNFVYDGYPRIIEPHTYGITTAGNEALRCYQVGGSGSDGKSTGWHLMTLDKILGLTTQADTFPGPHEGYQRGDSAFSRIFCEL